MAGVKRNYIYNLILTAGNYIFPLIVFPYISRVLGVENIGICNYVDSIIDYAVLFSALGVSSYGIREIARVKGNPLKMQEVYSSLLFFNLTMSVFIGAIMTVLTFTVPYLAPYKSYLLIGLAKLFFSSLMVEWLFAGLSEFRYITIRSLAVKTAYVAAVFIFVNSEDDTLIFFTITVLSIVANAVWNILYSGKFVHFSISRVNMRPYIVPILSYGAYIILTSMYTNFNITYLGSVTDNTQVGYYAISIKLQMALLSAFTALTTVMVPKVSELLEKGADDELRRIAGETFDILFACALPLIIICYFYSPLIIRIMAGESYEAAIMPFRILIILILVIGLEQIIIQQFLMAVRHSRCIVVLSCIGAVVGVVVNIMLVPHLAAIGSAISRTLSELCILIVSLYYFRKYFQMNISIRKTASHILASLPYAIICMLMAEDTFSIKTIIAAILLAVWFVICNVYIIPNSSIRGILKIK